MPRIDEVSVRFFARVVMEEYPKVVIYLGPLLYDTLNPPERADFYSGGETIPYLECKPVRCGHTILAPEAQRTRRPNSTSFSSPEFSLSTMESSSTRFVGGTHLTLFESLPVLWSRKRAAFALITVWLIVGFAQRITAQSGMNCHAMDMREAVPPDKLPPPLKLTGIGNAHIRITATPEAQMWFDQGLNLLHDFWDYESVRAFEQGVRVDPQCAMCYWGIYRALKTNYRRPENKYYRDQALAKAVSLKDHASITERLYIETGAAAAAAGKSAKKSKSTTESKELQLYRKLVKRDPKDMQARIFLAWTLTDGYDDDGQPRAGQKEALAIFQTILKEDPDNSAANHYWIHTVEASPHPAQALHSAEILARLAPTSAHIVHMPGHIFYLTGDYARAKEYFAASMKADEQYMQAQHVQVDDDWNYVHNLMYAIANLLEAG
jgi:tetratricopeptide (TPR) repeat protein